MAHGQNRDVAVLLAECYSHLNLISYKNNKEAKAISPLRAAADLREGKIYANRPVLKVTVTIFGEYPNCIAPRPSSEGYVKGYAIDLEKIKIFLNITDDADPRIDYAVVQILDFVDKIIVISFGHGSFDDDLEELKKREFTPPTYLEELAVSLLSDPDVFEFMGWTSNRSNSLLINILFSSMGLERSLYNEAKSVPPRHYYLRFELLVWRWLARTATRGLGFLRFRSFCFGDASGGEATVAVVEEGETEATVAVVVEEAEATVVVEEAEATVVVEEEEGETEATVAVVEEEAEMEATALGTARGILAHVPLPSLELVKRGAILRVPVPVLEVGMALALGFAACAPGAVEPAREAGEGEGEGEQAELEPPSGTAPTNLEDIPGGDKVVHDDDDDDKDEEETESGSDDEEDSDEGDEDGEVDDTSKYAEL
ncbi:hypothetical protein F5887DRAFT_1167143 [Amanita rubescens]|nr:hypothetical protein F5887DRAFT_1167143 [Amanita rubescens]